MVELAPAASTYAHPVVQLPAEMDRIVALADGISREAFLARVGGGIAHHEPTIGYRFADAIIADQTVYAGGSYRVVRAGRTRPVLLGAAEELEDYLLATDWACELFFGHWLTDGLSLELLAERIGLKALGLARQPWTQEPAYRRATQLAIRRAAHVHVRNLWTIANQGMNDDRVARMRELRRRVRGSVNVRGGGKPVFLRRVAGATRTLANQEALADALVRKGFDVLTPETEPVERLCATLAGARLVVSVEGSALCHAVVAMVEGGTILAIQPPERVNWIQKAWCDCAGLRFAQTVADPAGGAFTVGEDRLFRLIDLIDRENPI